MSAIALLDESGAVVREELHESGRSFDLPGSHRALVAGERLSKIAVAIGPGSFTGLRVGASFGLGLAIGLGVPIVPLPTLHIQAARCDGEVTAVAEAGRGRVYFLPPHGKPGLGEPYELPKDHAVVGWLREATRRSMVAAGLRFSTDSDSSSFGKAAARLLRTASEVPYGRLKLEYMQSFAAGV
jgi:tRNA A37 threonylcarbamoyladenosine modification protein TsaB